MTLSIERTNTWMTGRPADRKKRTNDRCERIMSLKANFFYQLTRVDVSEAHAQVRIEAV